MTMTHPVVASADSERRIESVGADGLSCVWMLPGLIARLSVFPFDAGLEPDHWVRPVNSWAFLWQLQGLGSSSNITLDLSFADPVTSYSASPDYDQRWIALTVDTGIWELVLGGPDEEQLAADAASGLVPAGWTTELEDPDHSPRDGQVAMLLPGMRGLRWNLPALDAGQHCWLGANACSSSSRSPAQSEDESTWFAALTTTANHLQYLATYIAGADPAQ